MLLIGKLNVNESIIHVNLRHSNGLLAYASQNTLVLVNVNTLKVFQTLTKHYAAITRVTPFKYESANITAVLISV